MSAILALIPGWLKAALGALLAVAIAFAGGNLLGKRDGASKAKSEALKADQKRAKEIENAADKSRANRDGNPVDRLRDSGRLR